MREEAESTSRIIREKKLTSLFPVSRLLVEVCQNPWLLQKQSDVISEIYSSTRNLLLAKDTDVEYYMQEIASLAKQILRVLINNSSDKTTVQKKSLLDNIQEGLDQLTPVEAPTATCTIL